MTKNIGPIASPYKRCLVVFSGVAHHSTESGYIAHRGFVREIDIWARIFQQVLVVTRTGSGQVLPDEVAYAEKNISIYCLPAPDNTDGIPGKLKLALYTPLWIWQSRKMLSPGDVIMARGPDSVGFLGWLVSRFTQLPRFAKYADQWENFPGEFPGYRLQKMFYRSKKFGGPVMIYGELDQRRPHLVPFFTSGVSQAEWEDAKSLIEDQRTNLPPIRFLFVGRFVFFKGIDILLDAWKDLNERHDDLVLDLVGDGPELSSIRDRIARLQLTNVHLHGWLGPKELSQFYSRANFFIHPSRKEGFGKVLLEAMSYGLPIVGADVGVSRELVEKNRCGLLFRNGDAVDLAHQIDFLLSSDSLRHEFTINGRRTSRNFVLENLEKQYIDFVSRHLQVL
jgi:glycosyltransferase involved in cell wall biosynthesis